MLVSPAAPAVRSAPAINAGPVPAGAAMAVALFNDEVDAADVGGLAVAQAQRRLLRRAGAVVRHVSSHADWHHLAALTLERSIATALRSAELRRIFGTVDAVVVNGGEGLFRRQGWHLVAILGAAQRCGLPTFLANASIQEVDAALPVLAALVDCSVRDARTARYLTSLGVPHRFVPDAIFAASFEDTPVHDFRSHLVVTEGASDQGITRAAVAAELGAAWLGPITAYSLSGAERVFDWAHAVADLRTAAAVVTGHFHGVCLALAAGVPFVSLPSPTADLAGLLETLDGYPEDAAHPMRPLADRLDAVLAARPWFHEQARRLRDVTPLATYCRLVPGLAPHVGDDAPDDAPDPAVDVVRTRTPIGGSVLHLGAGPGHVVAALAGHGYRAWGADVAWRLARPDRQRYSMATPTALPFADHVFSTVLVGAEWLQHLDMDDLPIALAEIARVGRDRVVLDLDAEVRPSAGIDASARGVEWWSGRLDAAGFSSPEAVAEADAPPRRRYLSLRAPLPACPACGRAHHGDEHDLAAPPVSYPVRGGLAAAPLAGASRG